MSQYFYKQLGRFASKLRNKQLTIVILPKKTIIFFAISPFLLRWPKIFIIISNFQDEIFAGPKQLEAELKNVVAYIRNVYF